VISATGGSDTNPPEEKPYSMAKIITPGRFFIPIHAKARRPVINEAGMSTFNGPTRSVIILGTIRPAIEAAFKIGRR
jgi:hypothetical protein